jgi:hypothetical protein
MNGQAVDGFDFFAEFFCCCEPAHSWAGWGDFFVFDLFLWRSICATLGLPINGQAVDGFDFFAEFFLLLRARPFMGGLGWVA